VSYTYLLQPWLAQGSEPPPGVRIPFDVIVLAAMERQDIDLPGYVVIRVPLDDSEHAHRVGPSRVDRMRIRHTAREIADRVRGRERVLVTCVQGRNRSGVLAGLAMRGLGIPGHEAARRIRQLRNGLTNPHFLSMVIQ
jgi:hypothetical protein